MPAIEIRALDASPDIREALSESLVEAVASGGSVSFMHPLALEVADTFWEGSLAAAARGERIVLGAFPFRFYRNGKALGAAGGNREKVSRFQAGAPDQSAVDVRNPHQFRRVRGLHRTAVEDADFRPFAAKPCNQKIPDKPMNLLDISGGRGQAGADRP